MGASTRSLTFPDCRMRHSEMNRHSSANSEEKSRAGLTLRLFTSYFSLSISNCTVGHTSNTIRSA